MAYLVPFFMSKGSRNWDITVNRKVGRVVKALCLPKEKLFILWPCFKPEDKNVKICAQEPSAFPGSSRDLQSWLEAKAVHFPFLNRGNRKASGLRLKRNTAHRFVIILIFDQGSFSIVGQSTEGSRRWFLFHLTVALVLSGQKLRRGATELSILGLGLLGPLKFKTRISFSVCTTSAVIKCWSSILACVCQKLELLPFFSSSSWNSFSICVD